MSHQVDGPVRGPTQNPIAGEPNPAAPSLERVSGGSRGHHRGCFAVTPIQSLVIGEVGGLVMLEVSSLLEKLEIDDAVGAVPVHAAAGVWGAVAVGIFGDLALLGTAWRNGTNRGPNRPES